MTPEIVTNNNIKLEIAPEINARVAQGQSVIMAPAGLDVQFRFPGNEMIEKYRANVSKGLGVINTVGISIPVEEIANKYSIKPPTYLLMTLTKDKDKFFWKARYPTTRHLSMPHTTRRAVLMSLSGYETTSLICLKKTGLRTKISLSH